MTTAQKMLFIGHGSPMTILEDSAWTANWQQLGKTLPTPKAILMVSAHWYTDATYIQGDPNPEMIYDMYGFPQEIYDKVYAAKTSPELIARSRELLQGVTEVKTVSRGYDHGCYAPLMRMYPKADIPLVQLSIDARRGTQHWYAVGQALRPLRDEGYLIIGSGNEVHNLRAADFDENSIYPECQAFDDALVEAVTSGDIATLLDWKKLKGAALSAAYPDHLAPLFYVLGAMDKLEPV
ncbi:MAG TPA: 4,5-DOPA dioxygenase extradiol, partial [Anaerolineaceae bacterium]|nr:4,5-DOPA dioxygenase extradiol [Anaerolineaceae bacterium]